MLTPVRPTRADEVRAKLAELDLTDADVAEAIAWARRAEKEGVRCPRVATSQHDQPD